MRGVCLWESAYFVRGSLRDAPGPFEHDGRLRLADLHSFGDLLDGWNFPAVHDFQEFGESSLAQKFHLLGRRQLIANVAHKFNHRQGAKSAKKNADQGRKSNWLSRAISAVILRFFTSFSLLHMSSMTFS